MLNGSARSKGQTSPSSTHTTHSSATAAYFNTCSKVFIDAYDREIRNLERIRKQELAADELMLQKAREEEMTEKEKAKVQKAELAKTTAVVVSQIQQKVEMEKKQKEKEQVEYNAVVTSMPPELVAVFPKIVETPDEVRKSIEKSKQKEFKAALESQMSSKLNRKQMERTNAMLAEMKQMKEAEAKLQKEILEAQQKDQERKRKYQEDLKKDIKCKEMRKFNEKRLEAIEFKGRESLTQLSVKKDQAFESPKIEQENVIDGKDELEVVEEDNNDLDADKDMAVIEQYFNDAPPEDPNNVNNNNEETSPVGNNNEKLQNSPSEQVAPCADPKLAYLLEKKQKRTNELLERLAELERGTPTDSKKRSLQTLRSTLTREGFCFLSGGKKTRVSGEQVFHSLSSRQGSCYSSASSRQPQQGIKRVESTPVTKFRKTQNRARHDKSESVKRPNTGLKDDILCFGTTDKTQKIAYNRYLSELESQANDEQRRILVSLKKEQEVIEALQKSEQKAKQEREKYRAFILRQITSAEEKRKTQKKFEREIPDIKGNEGYPPIPEPSPKEMRTTLKRLQDIQKIQEKADKRRRERDTMRETERKLLPTTNLDLLEKEEELKRKKEAQRKWKEIWDAEAHLRRIKCVIDYKRRDPIPLKQFSPPMEGPPEIRSPLVSLRQSRCSSLPKGGAQTVAEGARRSVFITGPEEGLASTEGGELGQRRNSQPIKAVTERKLVKIKKYY